MMVIDGWEALKDYRQETRESDRAGDDNAYIVESILDIEESDDGKRLFIYRKQFEIKYCSRRQGDMVRRIK